MPLKWEADKNPYVHHYFGILGLGANADRQLIAAQKKKLIQKLRVQGEIDFAGCKLDEHAVNDAQTKLYDAATLAHELLLVHPQPAVEKTKTSGDVEKILALTAAPEDSPPPPLEHPLALYWFIPPPGVEAAPLPEWKLLGLVDPGDPADLELDIVFDS